MLNGLVILFDLCLLIFLPFSQTVVMSTSKTILNDYFKTVRHSGAGLPAKSAKSITEIEEKPKVSLDDVKEEEETESISLTAPSPAKAPAGRSARRIGVAKRRNQASTASKQRSIVGFLGKKAAEAQADDTDSPQDTVGAAALLVLVV